VTFLRKVFAPVAALAVLAGCAGSGSPAPAPLALGGTASAARAAGSAKTGLIYVADLSNSAVHIYPLGGKNQTEIGLIKSVPGLEYLAVDGAHNLYVVEFGAGKVLVFPRGAKKPSRTLVVEPSGAFPNAVAISQSGEVAVGQFQTTGIEFYRKGATKPFKTVAPPAGFSAGFCAYDGSGNLYVVLSASNQASHIGEIAGGGKGTSITDLGANTGITNAKGIQVDTNGNLGVIGDAGTLNVYKAGSNTLLSTASLADPPSDGPNPNGGFSLLKSGSDLYLASAILKGSLGQAYKYAYPAGGAIRNAITVQNPPGGSGETAVTGVAVDPPETP
jgi:hypothetical protein